MICQESDLAPVHAEHRDRLLHLLDNPEDGAVPAHNDHGVSFCTGKRDTRGPEGGGRVGSQDNAMAILDECVANLCGECNGLRLSMRETSRNFIRITSGTR